LFIDTKCILFWNRMMRSDCTSSHFIRNSAMAVGSVYNVDVLSMSQTVSKTQFGLHLPVLFILGL